MLLLFKGRQGVITLHITIYCAVGQSTFFWFVASYLGFFLGLHTTTKIFLLIFPLLFV